VICVADFHD